MYLNYDKHFKGDLPLHCFNLILDIQWHRIPSFLE